MNFLSHPLTMVTFLPMVGFLVILFFREKQKTAIRWTALLASLVTFIVSLWILAKFDPSGRNEILRHDLLWFRIGGLPVNFEMKVDGLNILMILLTTFLTPLTILSAWNTVKDQVKGFMMFFLMLELQQIQT